MTVCCASVVSSSDTDCCWRENTFKHDDVCDVVCLHILNRFGVTLGNRFGRGTGPIWLDDVACTGSENHLFNCRHNGWGVHNCGHYEDVSISCSYGNVQNVTECAYCLK